MIRITSYYEEMLWEDQLLEGTNVGVTGWRLYIMYMRKMYEVFGILDWFHFGGSIWTACLKFQMWTRRFLVEFKILMKDLS